MRRIRRLVLAVAIVATGAGAAMAQQGPRPFRLQAMNFDLWCQETQHLPPARCDRRLPQDDAAFQTYTNLITNYEIRYLQRHEQERRIDRMLMANPSGNPPQDAGRN